MREPVNDCDYWKLKLRIPIAFCQQFPVMETQQTDTFSIKGKQWFLYAFVLPLLLLSVIAISVLIAFSSTPYPDLSAAPILFTMVVGILGAYFLNELAELTVSVTLGETGFVIKKWGHRPQQYAYGDILAHNERLNSTRTSTFNELTVYLPDNWFMLRSNAYAEYGELKHVLTYFGQPVPYRSVLTRAGRNRYRWFLGGMALLILANIMLGFATHNSVDKKPAQLSSVSAMPDVIRASIVKGNVKGISFRLHPWPDVWFFARRTHFDETIQPLLQRIDPHKPVTLLLRESDIQKKLLKKEPLTTGDKYIRYDRIDVFGIRQGADINVATTQPVREPGRTSPYLRLFFFGIPLVFCGTGWVWVEQQPVVDRQPAVIQNFA